MEQPSSRAWHPGCTYRAGYQLFHADLVADVDRLVAGGADIVVSDGHPVAALTDFGQVVEIETLVDWSVMAMQYWHNTDADGDRQRRREAELLVHRRIAVTELLGFACRTATMAEQVKTLLTTRGIEMPVLVRPTFYYRDKP